MDGGPAVPVEVASAVNELRNALEFEGIYLQIATSSTISLQAVSAEFWKSIMKWITKKSFTPR